MFKTLDEAINKRLELVDRIQAIEVQLAQRVSEISVGRVPDADYREYLQWKARALGARAVITKQLARTKLEIQRMRREESDRRLAARGSGDDLLDELYGLSKSLVAAGADISVEEQQLLDDVAAYLR